LLGSVCCRALHLKSLRFSELYSKTEKPTFAAQVHPLCSFFAPRRFTLFVPSLFIFNCMICGFGFASVASCLTFSCGARYCCSHLGCTLLSSVPLAFFVLRDPVLIPISVFQFDS
jgi:hypothetical protein